MTADTAGASQPRAAMLTVALCFAVMVVEGFDIQAMGVAAPALGPELKLSREVLGQALSASNIGLVIGAIAGGWLADVFGRKPVLIAAVATFGVFTLMTMQASSFEMLFAARLLTGLGFGGALPNVMAIAADVAVERKRGSTAAMMFCGMPVGGSFVALLSWLGYQGEWRPLFLIGGIIPLLLVPVLVFAMRETQAPERSAFSAKAAVPWLVAVPVGVAFWLMLEQLGRMPGAGSVGGVIAPWLGGVLGLLAAYMIVHRGTLFGGGRATASVVLWVIFFPTLLVVYLVLNWLPTLVAAKGFKADASLASVLFNVFSVVGALILGPLVDRFGLAVADHAGVSRADRRADRAGAGDGLCGGDGAERGAGVLRAGVQLRGLWGGGVLLSGGDARARVGRGDCVGAAGLGGGAADRGIPAAGRIGAGGGGVCDGAVCVCGGGGGVCADVRTAAIGRRIFASRASVAGLWRRDFPSSGQTS